MSQSSLISHAREKFHARLLIGGVLTVNSKGVPSNADGSNQTSVNIAKGIVKQLGPGEIGERLPGQKSGSQFEVACEEFIDVTFRLLSHLRPGNWNVTRIGALGKSGIARYEQYQHLEELNKIAKTNVVLASALGSDYIIAPDILIGRCPEPDENINQSGQVVDERYSLHSSLRAMNNPLPILHASISCKWTIRSDRAQNARSEALNLIRNRKGRLPHVAVVTGEPLPSRIASLALGTGDIDCVYHFALPELETTVNCSNLPDAQEMLEIMVAGNRLRDISDLPLDLAI
jgi:hypothetical protein